MVKQPSEKQRRIAKAKIKGKKNRDIAKIEYPNAKQESQDVIVSRELNKPAVRQYMEQAKLQAMKEYNIGWHRVMKVIDKGLDATKTDHYTGEQLEDIGTQLRAAKQASDYLELPKDTEEVKEEILKLASNSSEVEIVKAVFRKE